MRKFVITLFMAFVLFDFVLAAENSQKDKKPGQSEGLKVSSSFSQKLEEEMSKIENELNEIEKRERSCTPVVKNIYEILARCFTVLFDLQRFSPLLALTGKESKNDFIRASIIIKNFSAYFKNISSHLHNNASIIARLKREKAENKDKLKQLMAQYTTLTNEIQEITKNISKNKEETIIQNIVYHIATKATSIEELDAELESENAIGVLKDTKISTALKLAYPVSGRIVAEFGDKGENGDMIFYTAFECRASAVVTAPAEGLVVFSGNFLNYRNMIIISNGDYRVFLYGLETVFVTAGDVVKIGDYLGRMGDGLKTGKAILKLELRKSGEPLDARQWLQ